MKKEQRLRKWVLEYLQHKDLPKDKFFERADLLLKWVKGEQGDYK